MIEFQYSEEAQDILKQAQKQSLEDFTPEMRFWIYGSPLRPMSGVWAHIPDAIFVNADYQADKVHTWVVTSNELDAATIASYDLVCKGGNIVKDAQFICDRCESVVNLAARVYVYRKNAEVYYCFSCEEISLKRQEISASRRK